MGRALVTIRPVLVTGNPGKREETERILGRPLRVEALDLPEIQSLDLAEVLAEKGRTAWERLGVPLLVEETGLELSALGGFPGPLVKWMLAAVGAEGIARVGHALGRTEATARCLVSLVTADRAVVGEGAVTGRLVLPPRGGGGFGWDPVLEVGGRTFAEMGSVEKDRVGHRGRAWRDLDRRLAEQGLELG